MRHPMASDQGYTLPRGLITVGVDFDRLAKVVFVRLLHCKVNSLLPTLHPGLFGRLSLCIPHA